MTWRFCNDENCENFKLKCRGWNDDTREKIDEKCPNFKQIKKEPVIEGGTWIDKNGKWQF